MKQNKDIIQWPTPPAPFQPMHAPPIHISTSTQPSPYSHSKSPPSAITVPSAASRSSGHPNNLLPPPVIISPCAACRILRRRCADKCVLAPYFPPTEPLKFVIAHRIFGASNIIKFLQELPEDQRADAVSSLVYEANARTRDPIYGCAGVIFQLQNQVSELHAQLATAKAELDSLQLQQANLLALICMEMRQFQDQEGDYLKAATLQPPYN